MSIDNQNKVLVLSCLGGNGHEAARKAIEEEFGNRYQFHTYYPFKDLLISRIVNNENFYNQMIRDGHNQVINYLARVAPYVLLKFPGRKVAQKIEQLINTLQPSCVISLAPIINPLAIRVCAKHQIPYCLITLDADLTNWVIGLEKIRHLLHETIITIGADVPQTRGMLERKQIAPKAIHTIGFPIRKEFSQRRKERIDLCHSLKLDPDRKIIMLMWGGMGSHRMYPIMQKLGKESLGVQLVVITGSNHLLAERIKTLAIHPSNSLQVLGFTSQIADYMEVSDILITKPGPGTISEAIAMHHKTGRPYLFLDDNSNCLFWEKPNIDIAQKSNIGEAFNNEDELIAKIAHRLLNPTPIPHVSTQRSNEFSTHIVHIIDEMVENSRQTRYCRQFLKLFPESLQKALFDRDFFHLPCFIIDGKYSDQPLKKRAVTWSQAFRNFQSLSNPMIGLAVHGNFQRDQNLIYLYKKAGYPYWNVFVRADKYLREATFYTPDMISRISRLINPPEFQTQFFKTLLTNQNTEFPSSSSPEIWICSQV